MKKLLACILIILSLTLLISACGSNLDSEKKTTKNPDTNKTVPVYTGMTVSNKSPLQEASLNSIAFLSAQHGIDQNDPFGKGAKNTDFEKAIEKELPTVEAVKDEYFSKKNEDIYILIHITNPSQYEILSFTINGKKFANHMFEEGSTLELLILKYNVGDVIGTQSYTIDAIKYVDGESIKDVRMYGEKTIKVNITPEPQPSATLSNESVSFYDVSFTATISDPKNLISNSKGKVYAVIYDGKTLTVKDNIASTSQIKFENLKPNKIYQYAIIAHYDAINGDGKTAYILTKNAVSTLSPLSVKAEAVGFGLELSVNWHDDYNGTKTITEIAVYAGETKLKTVPADSTFIDDLPLNEKVTLYFTYEDGSKTYTVTTEEIQTPKPSEGLSIENGVITGIGDCTDKILYLDMPIADYAFSIEYGNHISAEEVYFGKNVTSIGRMAFSSASSIKKIGFPSGLTVIPESSFKNCIHLTSIVIPEGVSTIEDGAFDNCNSLSSVTLPESLNAIYGDPFSNCPLTPNYTDSGFKYLGNKTNPYFMLIGIENKTLTSYSINQNTKAIASNVFSGFTKMESISLPSGLTAAGSFSGCTSLQTINLPNSLISIGGFIGCTSLKAINLPEGLTSIGSFEGCTALQSITLPNTLKNMPNFSGCTSLKSVNIPLGIKRLNYIGFSNCTSLESITIPGTVECFIISSGGFNNCTSLKTVTFCDGVRKIYISAYDARIFTGCTSLTKVNLPNTLEQLYGPIFSGCTALTSIDLPDSLFFLESSVFEGSGITPTYENGVGYIDKWAVKIDGNNPILRDDTVGIAANLRVANTLSNLSSYENAKYLGSTSNPYALLVSLENTYVNSCDIHPDTKFILAYAFSPAQVENLVIPGSVKNLVLSSPRANNLVISAGAEHVILITDIYGFSSLTLPNTLKYFEYGEHLYNEPILSSITFTGTKQEWNALKKLNYNASWDNQDFLSKLTIKCTDGDILPTK